jgi:predicted chitinase
MNTLRQGMTGPEVQQWQEFLIREGFLHAVANGNFGPQTHAATVAFQRAKGLTPDGVVGQQTVSFASGLTVSAVGATAAAPAVSGGASVALTESMLKQIMPGIRPDHSASYLPFLKQAMAEFEIISPRRVAAFLAQLAHESGQLKFMEEIWGPTDAQRRYEPPGQKAQRLGNTQPGDGRRFKGRGPIQLTGRDNYKRFSELLGLDLVGNPETAATREVGFRIAGLFWKGNGLNELADVEAFEKITKRINGGLNGFEDRKKFYFRARTVLGVSSTRGTRGPSPTIDESKLPRLGRGLDDPGEITPVAAERNAPTPEPVVEETPSKKVSKKATKATKTKAAKKQASVKATKTIKAARTAKAVKKTAKKAVKKTVKQKAVGKKSVKKASVKPTKGTKKTKKAAKKR